MKQLRLSHIAVLVAALGLTAVPELTTTNLGSIAFADEAIRPEVAKIVAAASDLYKSKKFKEALTKLQETNSVSGKTVQENFTIERMRLAVASAAGDNDSVIRASEAIIASGKQSNKDQLVTIQVLANAYFKAGNYSKAVQYYNRYYADGGTDQSLRPYLIQAMAQSGDASKALKEVVAEINADERAGRTPKLSSLEFWADIARRGKDDAGYASAVEKMISYHGKKEYWINLLSLTERKAGFSERLKLDVWRLKLSLGLVKKPDDYMNFALFSIQNGFPGEAVKTIDDAFKTGAFTETKPTDRQPRLRNMANKALEENKTGLAKAESEAKQNVDGSALVNIGYNYVTSGQTDKGLAMMEEGVAKGHMKYPEDAKLRLGIAYAQAGKKANAIKVLKTVKGTDGTADLARLWILYANQNLK